MPLLDIVGVSGNDTNIQLGVVFLQLEKEEQYTWAIAQLNDLFELHGITLPLAFFTD